MSESFESFEWALTEVIDVTQISGNTYRVQGTGSNTRSLTLTFVTSPEAMGRSLLINGDYVDVGDDLIPFCSIIDDYQEQGGGGIGITVRQQPYEEL